MFTVEHNPNGASDDMSNAKLTAITLSANSQEYYWSNGRLYVLEHTATARTLQPTAWSTTVHDATDWTIDDTCMFLNY